MGLGRGRAGSMSGDMDCVRVKRLRKGEKEKSRDK